MHVFLFDIDGTLLNSGGAGKHAIETALCEDFGVPPLQTRIAYSGRTDRAIIRDLLRASGVPETDANVERLVAGYLRRLPASLASHQGQVLPGIAELLSQLAGRPRTAVGLLTGNLRRGARAKLGHFDLHHHFAFGGFGDHHWDRDDVAREAWAVIHEKFNGSVAPNRVWVIGDTPLDVQCARAIGVQVAAVATGWHDRAELAACGPDLLLDDLSDPAPLLDALAG